MDPAAFVLAIATAVATPDVVATPGPSAASSPTPAPLREIGHVRAATTFCSALEAHFDGAVRPLLAADEHIGSIGFTLGTIESHFNAIAPELLVADDRIHLLKFVTDLQKSIVRTTTELDALRASAALATDPDSAATTRAVATSLGNALEKQRQLATDSLGVAHALMDLALGNGVGELHASVPRNIRDTAFVDPLAGLDEARGDTGPAASTDIGSHLPGAYDAYTATTPAAARDVREYLKWQKQLDRIGDFESDAARGAAILADRCR